jgi:hypothetical protein
MCPIIRTRHWQESLQSIQAADMRTVDPQIEDPPLKMIDTPVTLLETTVVFGAETLPQKIV